jgi:hypothetical protein
LQALFVEFQFSNRRFFFLANQAKQTQ